MLEGLLKHHMPRIDINEVSKTIACLFHDVFSGIDINSRIIHLDGEEFKEISEVRCDNEIIHVGDLSCFIFNIPKEKDVVEQYLAVKGNHAACESEGLEEIEFSKLGIYVMVAFGLLRLNPEISSNDVEQFVSPFVVNGLEDVSEIERMFEPFRLYRFDDGLIEQKDLPMLLTTWLIHDDSKHILPFDDETKAAFSESTTLSVYDHYITEAYLSTRWHYCYLEIYRCIEPLFVNIFGRMLITDLNLNRITDEEICQRLRKYNIMLPNEQKSLEEMTQQYLTDDLYKIFMSEFCVKCKEREEAEKADPADKPTLDQIAKEVEKRIIARHIYKLRNAIVHHRDSQHHKKNDDDISIDYTEYSEDKWQVLCRALLRYIIVMKQKLQ